MKAIVLTLLLTILAHTEETSQKRQLHVATWPSHAEVFQAKPPEPGRAPAPRTPCVLTIPADSSWIRLHFFRPGYADTALDVSLPRSTESYLLVHLRPETDETALEAQAAFLSTRTRHRWGYRLMWGSLIPAFAAAILAAKAEWHYQEADRHARSADASTLTSGDAYQAAQENYSASINDGNGARSKARWALGSSAILLATGFILTF